MKPFSLSIALPEGPTLIEASAGTGKTWSIARLLARLLVEPGPNNTAPPTIEQVLVVTFTRAATAELRERIRGVLVQAAAAIQTALATEAQGAEPAVLAKPDDPGFAVLIGTERTGQWQALPDSELIERLGRLRQAVNDFDLAPVLTIHAFCQRLVQQLAFESHSPLDGELSTATDPLVQDLVDDWLAKYLVPATAEQYAWLTGKDGARLSRDRLLKVAKARVAAKGAVFLPEVAGDWLGAWASLATGTADPMELAALVDAPLVDFANWFADQYAAKLQELGLLTYDDLMVRVAHGLGNPDFVTAVRHKLSVALIDEFQDTDAVQWAIFRQLFVDAPGGRLVLIGDPKQAIYRFRNADVAVYNEAKSLVTSQWPDRVYTLEVNHRSDAALVEALNQMLETPPSVFLGAGIPYQRVRAKHGQRLFAGNRPAEPVSIRWFDGQLNGKGEDTPLSASDAAQVIVPVVAADVAALLQRGWHLQGRHGRQPVRARDIAVLTATNHGARAVRDALLQVGVPAVVSQSGSIFASEEAKWLQQWLTALVHRADSATARAFASTPLGGWSGEQIQSARLGEDKGIQDDWQTLLATLHAQHKTLTKQSVTAAFSAMLYGPSGPNEQEPDQNTALARLARAPTAERMLTNLRHLAEKLEAAQMAEFLDAAGLERWLAEQRRDSDKGDETAELRLESDADTVTIMTMHSSKGLQFPLVFLPDLASGQVFKGKSKATDPLQFHDSTTAELAVHLAGMDRAEAEDVRSAFREGLQERQRLLYVALTRAEHHLVLYAGPVTGLTAKSGVLPDAGFERSPLGLLWLGSGPDNTGIATAAKAAKGAEIDERAVALRQWVAATAATFTAQQDGEAVSLCGFSTVGPAPRTRLTYLPQATADLVATAHFRQDDLPDTDWRRESYTNLVGSRTGEVTEDVADQAQTEGPPPAQGPEQTAELDLATGDARSGEDEGHEEDLAEQEESVDFATTGEGTAEEIPLRKFPGGVEAGKWVHAVFEHLAFGPLPLQTTSGEPVADLVRQLGLRNGFLTSKHDALLLEHLPAILRTPMGPQVGQVCLADVADAERLNELNFDLPICPSPRANQQALVSGRALANQLGRDRSDVALPAGYLAGVRTMGFRDLRGFLTGSIDLVFRAQVGEHQRWFVADYKTNTLGSRKNGRIDRSLPQHYDTEGMAQEVAKKHYYIQYLLYLTALHRYLTVRLPGYDYDLHMGGAVYLFVRGMVGPDTAMDEAGNRCGVFVDRPPKDLIVGLSDLFAGTAAGVSGEAP